MCELDKSYLFKQVNNSQLDRLSYQIVQASLGTRPLLESPSPVESDSSGSDSYIVMDSNEDTETQPTTTTTNELDQSSFGVTMSNVVSMSQTCSWSALNPNASPFQSVRSYRSMSSTSASTAYYGAPPMRSLRLVDKLISKEICTLHMDMTYDDRLFFGMHNFFELKQHLIRYQCNIDFSAPDNKVSIIGQLANVQRMAEMFIGNTTIAMQYEFQSFNDEFLDHLKQFFDIFHQQCEQYSKVYVTYKPLKPDKILFTFLSFRFNTPALIQAMRHLKSELEYFNLGEFKPVTTTMQLPANRKDLTGRANSYIEFVQQKTQTKIEMMRYEEFPQYPFDNVIITGRAIEEVVHARFLLFERFSYELKFQVPMCDTRLLVDCISKVSNDLKSIYISIEPCTSIMYKIISINGNESSFHKLFTLRNQLVNSLEIRKAYMMRHLHLD